MCNRLLSIIPLTAWVGQWAIGVPAILPAPGTRERAWLPMEDSAALVVKHSATVLARARDA
jgi:hypothetical protein